MHEAGYGNAGVPPELLEKGPEDDAQPCFGAWEAYAAGKAYVAATPAEEAAARIVRKRSFGSFSVKLQRVAPNAAQLRTAQAKPWPKTP